MIVLTTFIGLLVFYFFFQGEINQGNLKTYQRTVGRKLFIFYHITLNILLSFLIFLTCLFLFYGQYLHFLVFFFLTRDLFHTFFFQGKFYTNSGSRLPFAKLFNGLAEKFPREKIPQLKHLIECNFFYVSQVTFCNWPSSVVVRRPLTVAA